MDQENKKSKKKILTYYLILAACILAIAVVTVTIIFTLNSKTTSVASSGEDSTIDVGGEAGDGATDGNNENNADGNGGNDSSSAGGDSVDASSKNEFAYPIGDVNMLNTFTFYRNTTLNNYYVHQGIDFSAPAGTEVYACLDGVVESITTGSILNGTVITLSHDNGIKTTYTFVTADPELQAGDAVSKGEVIGTVAEAVGCEYKDGPHLHFEVHVNGKLADPDLYLVGGEK